MTDNENLEAAKLLLEKAAERLKGLTLCGEILDFLAKLKVDKPCP